METMWLLLFASFLFFIDISLANIPRPRGVAISKAGAYDPTRDFHCLDGSKKVPFEYVNDDYCDCPDGSDEPGTSACSNGWFHCTNAGHIPLNIVSSRVNDGICDCCDGSDEYEGIIACSNTCKELGKKAREEAEKQRQLVEQAMKVKVEYAEQGKKAKEEKKARLSQLETDRVSTEAKRNDLEAKKNDAEAPEKEAKEKHEKAWEAERDQRKAEKERVHAEAAFNELDTNDDNIVDIPEMVAHMEFDIDGNGEVSEDEAKEYLEEQESVDVNHFVEKMWPNIKEIYKPLSEASPPSTEPPSDQVDPPPAGDGVPSLDDIKEGIEDLPPDSEDPEEGDDDEEEDSDHDDGPEESEDKGDNAEEEEKMPDYDADTQALIQAADEARSSFKEADEALKGIDSEISDINAFLDLDLGPNDEYSFLRGNCFEMTDREYIYKLCPFDKASQRPKNGGAETSLGNWGHWSGPENNKYASMKYDRGQNCWNGPDRSVEVKLHCGLENLVTSASEPNRCEYQFDFSTPAFCSAATVGTEDHTRPPHTEL